MKRVAAAVLLLALLGVSACGNDDAPEPAPPSLAKVAPEQSTKPGLRGSLEEEEAGRISFTEATRLAAKGDRRAIEPLLYELANTDDELHRAVAADHLMKLKAASAVPVLVGELQRLSEFKHPRPRQRLSLRRIVMALEGITGIRHDRSQFDFAEAMRLWMEWYDARSSAPPR